MDDSHADHRMSRMQLSKSGEAISVALYARVSSERQAADLTIASQVDALRQRIDADGFVIDESLCFLDEGYSGETLLRPALEQLHDELERANTADPNHDLLQELQRDTRSLLIASIDPRTPRRIPTLPIGSATRCCASRFPTPC